MFVLIDILASEPTATTMGTKKTSLDLPDLPRCLGPRLTGTNYNLSVLRGMPIDIAQGQRQTNPMNDLFPSSYDGLPKRHSTHMTLHCQAKNNIKVGRRCSFGHGTL